MFSIIPCWVPVPSGRMAGKQLLCMHHLPGKGHFDQDKWELYHVDVDRSESNDLAKENPEKLEALKKLYDGRSNEKFCITIG